jgi:hypothetical protein
MTEELFEDWAQNFVIWLDRYRQTTRAGARANGQDAVLFMDNCTTHRSLAALELLNKIFSIKNSIKFRNCISMND